LAVITTTPTSQARSKAGLGLAMNRLERADERVGLLGLVLVIGAGYSKQEAVHEPDEQVVKLCHGRGMSLTKPFDELQLVAVKGQGMDHGPLDAFCRRRCFAEGSVGHGEKSHLV
jgi:hypothetical protein